MAKDASAQQFFQSLMGEVPPLTEEEIQVMEPVFEYMQQVRGKPALESTAQVYDLLTGTEKRASFSHEMMWYRIVKTSDCISSLLPEKGTMLDLGSNTGHQPLFWASKRPDMDVHGIEISLLNCEVAEGWRAAQGIENCSFHHGNFFEPHPVLSEKKFDVVTSCFSMETVHEFYTEYDANFPSWILDSLSKDGKVIAFLTVPNAKALEKIILNWNSQGLRLNSIEMVKTPNRNHAHPLLVLSKSGESLPIEPIDWFTMEAARLLGSLWLVHNPPGDNPFDYGEYDDYNLEHCLQYPMRIETWRFGKGYQYPDENRVEDSLVMELTHPSWIDEGTEFYLVLQFISQQDSPCPIVSIRAQDGSTELPDKVMNLLQESVEVSKDPNHQPMLYLSKYVEALKQIYI